MSERGIQISTSADFSRVAVYERPRPSGNIYTVAFTNRETRPESQIWVVVLVAAALLAWFIAGFVYVPAEHVFVAVFLPCLFAWVGLIAFLARPYRRQIAIELDFGQWLFRVRKDGKTTFEHPLGSFHNLTVEDHPDLADERARRMERGQKGPGEFEKTHVLVGWFGAEGSQRADLVYRFEWPKRYSLQEVAGAVNWAIKRETAAADRMIEAESESQALPRRTGLAPPLD